MRVSALVFVAEEMRLVDQHQQPKQIKWQQTGGGGEDIGGDTTERWNVFLFSCFANGSYFHPRADIAPDT